MEHRVRIHPRACHPLHFRRALMSPRQIGWKPRPQLRGQSTHLPIQHVRDHRHQHLQHLQPPQNHLHKVQHHDRVHLLHRRRLLGLMSHHRSQELRSLLTLQGMYRPTQYLLRRRDLAAVVGILPSTHHRRICQLTYRLDLKLIEHRWYLDHLSRMRNPTESRMRNPIDLVSTHQGHPWVVDRRACNGFGQVLFPIDPLSPQSESCRLKTVNDHSEHHQKLRNSNLVALLRPYIRSAHSRVHLAPLRYSAHLATWTNQEDELPLQNGP